MLVGSTPGGCLSGQRSADACWANARWMPVGPTPDGCLSGHARRTLVGPTPGGACWANTRRVPVRPTPDDECTGVCLGQRSMMRGTISDYNRPRNDALCSVSPQNPWNRPEISRSGKWRRHAILGSLASNHGLPPHNNRTEIGSRHKGGTTGQIRPHPHRTTDPLRLPLAVAQATSYLMDRRFLLFSCRGPFPVADNHS